MQLWYIQTFPELSLDKRSSTKKRNPGEFQQILQQHMNELECPQHFISLLDDYDFSLASEIRLVVSQPGVVSPSDFHLRSIGRMGSVAREWISRKERDQVNFEVCCASLGALKGEWMESLDWLLRGKDPEKLKIGAREEEEEVEEEDRRGKGKGKGKEVKKKRRRKRSRGDSDDDDDEGDWKIVYSPSSYVKGCTDEVRTTAVNMSSYWKDCNWVDVPPETRKLFYTYHSKEPGRLFHQKTILWLSSTAPRSTPPHLLYLGSHNFSSAAWGTPAFYSSNSKKKGVKTEGVNNYEMGIMIRGEKIEEMLEKGSKWDDIVTWERPVERFEEDDIPWVSESWVKKVKESSEIQDGSK